MKKPGSVSESFTEMKKEQARTITRIADAEKRESGGWAALRLVESGSISCFPCQPPKKVPALCHGIRMYEDANKTAKWCMHVHIMCASRCDQDLMRQRRLHPRHSVLPLAVHIIACCQRSSVFLEVEDLDHRNYLKSIFDRGCLCRLWLRPQNQPRNS